MNIELKTEAHWVLVGKLLEGCADQGFRVPLSKGNAFLKLEKLDLELPIIRHKTKKQISRVQIYESLWKAHSSKLISYFFNDDKNQKLLRETLYKELPTYPKSPYFSTNDNLDLFIMNTENVFAAITEILAYSCSEKKVAHLTSKSKSTTKEHYVKDETYKALLQMSSLYEKNNLTEDFFKDLYVTEYVEIFSPHAVPKIMDLHNLFVERSNDNFYELLQKLITEIESISKRDDMLRKRVTEAADHTLTLYLSDRTLKPETQDKSDMLKNADYVKYRKTTGLKIKQLVQKFEKEHPVFKIERMDLIRNAITDLNNFLKSQTNEKPIRDYREISKHIREYRNSESFYVFGKPFVKRKRNSRET